MDIYKLVISPWFWLALTIIFSFIELASSFNLITIWFAGAALVMVFVSGLTEMFSVSMRFNLHLGLFVLLSVILLFFTRPVVVKKLKVGKTKTNIDDLIGRTAVVTKEIVKHGRGEIKLSGQIWTAISADNKPIKQGTEVIVCSIEGVKAVVKINK